MNYPPDGPPLELDSLERQVVEVFVDGVRVLGLPRSIGEIYGLLFISRSPLSLDDLAAGWQTLGAVSKNPFLARLNVNEPACEITVFKDGRAIIQGTDDPTVARGLYARYVGN